MSVSNLAAILSVIFCLSIVGLIGAYLYVHWHHRSFRHRSSPAPPIRSRDETPNFSIIDGATKEQLYFFYMKPFAPIKLDPHEPPIKNTDGSSSPEDHVVDVFKLKEEDKDEIESTPDVDFSIKPNADKDAVVVTVDRDDGNPKTVFSTPCDSPMFFTPVGSPSRDFIVSEFVVAVHKTENSDER